ncbi:MAG: hypothetical protein R3232_12310 [Clostridia bacterium]|nr:hypothetical protein [Clostridia bacterium]
MISVLLGLMLTLQPVNVTGLKSGWEQLSASIIGGGVTALIVLVGGINFITVPLAVAATLYITLRINWRSMSVIAVFTSIYMTQYIQLTAAGEASMYLTLRLRFLALGSGILIAVVINFLFSLIFYRSMLRKRTVFTIEKLVSSIDSFVEILTGGIETEFDDLEKQIIVLFGDIDYIIGGMMDMKRKKTKDGRTASFILKMKELRNINHYILDLVMMSEDEKPDDSIKADLILVREQLENLDDYIGHKSDTGWAPVVYEGDNNNIRRIYKSLSKISHLI